VGLALGTQSFVFSYDGYPRLFYLAPTNAAKRGD
jgi:hypothetical protein